MFFVLDIFLLTETLQQNVVEAKYLTLYLKVIFFICFLSFHDVVLVSTMVYLTPTVI
jgi:hypothetical protein